MLRSLRSLSVQAQRYQRGKTFEQDVVVTLSSLLFDVRQVGAANDGGVDFRGTWHLPRSGAVSVVGQCKSQSRKTSSAEMRDFESALLRESNEVVGIFVSEGGFSPPAQQHFRESRLPLILVQLLKDAESPKPSWRPGLVLINGAARRRLPSVSIARRLEPQHGGVTESSPVVMDDDVIVAVSAPA